MRVWCARVRVCVRCADAGVAGVTDRFHMNLFRASLRKCRLLASVTEESELDDLLNAGEMQQFYKGDRIIVQGSRGDDMYIVLQGSVYITVNQDDGGEKRVKVVKTSDYFGGWGVRVCVWGARLPTRAVSRQARAECFWATSATPTCTRGATRCC